MSARSLLLPLFALFLTLSGRSQTVFWTENFNNGCPDNCEAATYTGPNGAWTVVNIGTQGSVANEWFVSCSENGEPVGSCGAGCGNDQTLHVGSVPCSLCLFCSNGDCGASYNAGPTFGGEDPTTDKRAVSPPISTLGKSGLTIDFQWIENGSGTNDDGSVEYSTNGGTTWNLLVNLSKTSTCPSGQGLWTAYSAALPATCENIADLRIGFRWKNNSDGVGTDPSFAIDNVTLSEASGSAPLAAFQASDSTGCDSLCITFNDLSTGSPTAWNWSFPGGSPASSTAQQPGSVCYSTPGTYTVTLTVSNGSGSNSLVATNLVRVQAGPRADFSCSDSSICAGDSIDFFDQSSGTIASRTWLFAGATPFTSSAVNPTGILFPNAGTYTVTLTVDDGQCSNSKSQINFITVNALPQPSLTELGADIFCDPVYLDYQWFELGTGPLTETGPTLSGVAAGSYYVLVTDSNGCSAFSDTAEIIDDAIFHPEEFGVILFPNPVSEFLNVEFPIPQCFEAELQDIQGRVVRSWKALCTKAVLELGDLPSGYYRIRFLNEQMTLHRQLVKR
jgi:PKD repeat protein